MWFTSGRSEMRAQTAVVRCNSGIIVLYFLNLVNEAFDNSLTFPSKCDSKIKCGKPGHLSDVQLYRFIREDLPEQQDHQERYQVLPHMYREQRLPQLLLGHYQTFTGSLQDSAETHGHPLRNYDDE